MTMILMIGRVIINYMREISFARIVLEYLAEVSNVSFPLICCTSRFGRESGALTKANYQGLEPSILCFMSSK